MKEHLLQIDGFELTYYETGSQSAPTIVCLHGLAGSALYSFSELLNNLSDSFHLIAIDQPGHGKSTPFSEEKDYLFLNLVKWYEKVLPNIITEPFYLLGHSWGADVVLHYAKQFPTQLKGIILLDGGFTFPQFQEDMSFSNVYNGWNQYMEDAKYDDWEQIVTEFKQYTHNPKFKHQLSSIFIKKEKYELIASKFTVLSIIKAFFTEAFSETYPFIKNRLLLIHATEPEELDHARTLGISQLRKNIENVSVISFPNTGHMVQWDLPEKVADTIINWVNKMEG
ncbi:alpha/beta hydrolase [Mesobacillus maritimus]|uniref:alpha/beta fold hydrolase n=1 Tax=Mesobacillus maritimus TaxID=1643336 RepID=UPI0020422D19|nr:alpha/beta hydrolase [Mesobacillus maritimus]MCM3584551.1 alpha/beta hydrolase [Mesobacillus maritimus]